MISIIVAVARNNVIGGHNKLLWRLPADLKHFKDITSGHAIIMGRKTFESIGRPLPNRRNIVITRAASADSAFVAEATSAKEAALAKAEAMKKEGIEVAHSLDAALALAGNSPFPKGSTPEGGGIFIIGGGEIFRQALPLAERVYLTKVDAAFDGDVFFPELGPEWKEVSRQEGIIDEKNIYPHAFLILERFQG